MALAWLVGTGAGLANGASWALIWPALLAGGAALLSPRGSFARRGALLLSVALLAMLRAAGAYAGLEAGPLTELRGQVVTFVGTVAEPPRCSTSSCLFVLDVDRLETTTESRNVEGLVQVRTRNSEALSFGRIVEVRGELEPPRPAAGWPKVDLLARRGIHEVMEYPRVRYGAALEGQLRGHLESFRSGLERRLAEHVAGPEGRLAAGLLLGRDVSLPPEIREQLRATGTSHILAVSGFNVAIVGGLVLSIALRLLARGWALGLASSVVAAYTLLVGAPPSATRAALMFGSTALATVVGRLPDPVTSLLFTAVIMCAVDPLLLLDLGFQLSFAATAGLVLYGSQLTPTWRLIPRDIASVLGLTLSAQLLTLPLVVSVFHSVSLIAPLTNVLIAPLLPALMGFSVLALLTAGWPLVGGIVAGSSWMLAHAILGVVAWTADLPGATLATGSLPTWALVFTYLLILAPASFEHLARLVRRPNARSWGQAGALLAAAGFVAVAIVASFREPPGERLRALFFDASGDGLTLVETPSGRRVLMGSASSPLAANVLADQLPLLDRTIDLLVATRSGERDLEGMIEITRRYPVAMVLLPGAGGGAAWSRWNDHLVQTAIPVVEAEAGLEFDLGGGVGLELVGQSDPSGRTPALSLRLQYGKLDLRVAGWSEIGAIQDPGAVVVRLAPELGLSEHLRTILEGGVDRSLVIGGRGTNRGESWPGQVQLQNGDVVELTSDGFETRVRRLSCSARSGSCPVLEMTQGPP